MLREVDLWWICLGEKKVDDKSEFGGAMSKPTTNKCIVIVEDDTDVRETLTELLEDEGYHPVGFSSGYDALKYLKETPKLPALILLDLMMPVMDGWEFREAQQGIDDIRDIPTVILSADNASQRAQHTLAATDYLSKPIHITTLLNLVEHYCGAPQSS